MHDRVQLRYDPIQGQGQGHEPVKVGNSDIIRGYLPPFIMGLVNDHGFLHLHTIPKAYHGRIFKFVLVFVT